VTVALDDLQFKAQILSIDRNEAASNDVDAANDGDVEPVDEQQSVSETTVSRTKHISIINNASDLLYMFVFIGFQWLINQLIEQLLRKQSIRSTFRCQHWSELQTDRQNAMTVTDCAGNTWQKPISAYILHSKFTYVYVSRDLLSASNL